MKGLSKAGKEKKVRREHILKSIMMLGSKLGVGGGTLQNLLLSDKISVQKSTYTGEEVKKLSSLWQCHQTSGKSTADMRLHLQC